MSERFELQRPEGIDDNGWAAVCAGLSRLVRAWECGDWSDVIGKAKDVIETVAKVTLAARGESPTGKVGQLVTAVHRSLDSDPGKGRAADDPVRTMVTSARKLVLEVPPYRNAVGTGHGKTVLPEVEEEQAGVAADASILWSRWALGRFGVVHRSSPAWLVDLLDGSIFRRGDIAGHLDDLGLDKLSAPDLERLGRALAQRGGWGGTMVVWADGVAPALRDPEQYPASFRRGLLFGLFFSREGTIETSSLVIDAAAQLAAGLGDMMVIADLVAELEGAPLSPSIRSDGPPAIAAAVRAELRRFTDPAIQARWLSVAERFEPRTA